MGDTPFPGVFFPAIVTVPDGRVFDTCKVVRSTDGVTVWHWDEAVSDAVPLIRVVGEPVEGDGGWRLTMPEGGVAFALPQGGCACSHPMKHWTPPGPVVAHGP